MSLDFAQRQTLAWTAIAAVAAWLVWRLAPVLTPFLVGAGLAYALRPAVERLVARRWPRALAVLLVEFVAILAAAAVLLLIVPVLAEELPQLRAQLPTLADRALQWAGPWLQRLGVPLPTDGAGIRALMLQHVDANAGDWMTRVFASARIGGSYLVAAVGNAVLVPLVLFYLLADWPRLAAQLETLVPPRMRERTVSFLVECDLVLGQYLRGQLLVMLLLAAYYAVALGIAGFHLALPVGVITGLLVFIPYLGFGLGLLLALLASVLQFGDFYGLAAVAVVYGCGQVLESFFLTPRLVGERIGLSPLAVIFALLAFGELFGFVGVLIALPVSAVLLVAVRRAQRLYVGSRLYLG